jgi:excisionase family DNA binding protein
VPTKAERWFSVPGIARQLAVNPSKVRAWIASGQLVAVNVAARLGGRPRWRIRAADLEAFLATRRAEPGSKPARRRRRKKQPGDLIEFF